MIKQPPNELGQWSKYLASFFGQASIKTTPNNLTKLGQQREKFYGQTCDQNLWLTSVKLPRKS